MGHMPFPEFILINNAEFVQIGGEETKKSDEEFKTLNCGYRHYTHLPKGFGLRDISKL